MCVSVLSARVCMSVCQVCVSGACEGQKKASVPLELELHTVVNCYVGTWNQHWGLWKSSILNL